MKHARLSVSPRYALTLFSLAAVITLAVALLPFMHKLAEAKSVKASAATRLQTNSAAVVGQWGNLIQFQTVPVHISLLPNGKLLYWGRDKGTDNRDVKGGCRTYLVDPANFNQTTTIRNDTTNLFCSGHSFLPDGRLLVTGGHDKYDPSPLTEGIGERAVNTFDYKTNIWKKIGLMNLGRWYPYNVTLENGDVAIFAGSYWDGQTFSGGVPVTARNIYPDRYRYNSQGDGTITAFDISQEIGPQIEKYPFLHLAPDGKVFIAGPSTIVGFPSYMFDPTEPLPPGATHFKAYNPTGLANFTGSSVLYDAANGKIMVMGGSRGLGGATLQDASIINLSETTYPNSPPWRPAAPMSYKRKFHTATLLPDGKVLVSGGTQCTGANDLKCPDFPSGGAAALNPELWDPQTGLWTTMAPNPSGIPRVYHSTAILLPDATVLIGGGGLPAAYGEIPDGTDPSGDLARIFKHSDGEIFSPPYLFNSAGQPAARPIISSIQADKIGLGQTMQVVTPDASNISSVVLIRLGSVTHGFNQDQRRLLLSFAATGSNTLNVTMPATGKLCPPGPYMLFLLNANGTPSVAKIITVLTEPQIITAGDTVWVEDNVPAGGIQEGNGEGWNWISSNPPPYTGTLAQQSNIVAGMHQHYFYGATNTLTVNTGDKLIAYVYLDPLNLPSEVMLQWNDGTWEHRAYWGTNQIGLGVDGTASRRSMGALPPAGQWVRLEVPASLVGLEGRTLNGMAFTLYGGRATWDHAGKYAPPVNFALATNGGQAFASSTHPSGSFPISAIINGDRTGTGWGTGSGGWSDGTPNQFPDYLEIHFNGEKLINEIDITTLQDNYQSPVEPTLETTFSLFGITDYNVGYFDSATNQWVYVAYIRNSLKVMNQIKLSGVVRTQKLSIVILNARSSNYPSNYSRVVEVEAWGQDIPVVIPPPPAPGPSVAPSPCSVHSGGNMDPCELSRNLLSAMGGNRTDLLPYRHDNIAHNDPGYRSANWTSQLDWTYNSWRHYGSQNKPLLAHALTLWRDPVEYGHTTDAAIDWWVQFLHCQTRDQQCTVTDPVMLQYFKGAELFSNTYDGDINLAVIATRYWAIKQIPTLTPGTTRYNQVNEVAFQAGRYLRLTWALYALGSGKGPASRILNRYNHTDSPPYDNLSDQGCNGSSYNGPFLAMAGMRSTPMHPCEDNRARMLGHAINWAYRGNGADSYIEDIVTFITQHLSASDPYAGNNAYGVDSYMSGILRRHIDGLPNPGEDTTAMIYDFLKNIRTAVPYNFVGATANGQEARLTLMEDNMNQETAPIFAVTYDYGQRLARILFPWSNHNNGCFPLPDRPWRKINVLGHADFKPNENMPVSVYATSANRGASSSSCKGTEYGLPMEEEFVIPSNWQWKYHIKFTPTGDAQRLR